MAINTSTETYSFAHKAANSSFFTFKETVETCAKGESTSFELPVHKILLAPPILSVAGACGSAYFAGKLAVNLTKLLAIKSGLSNGDANASLNKSKESFSNTINNLKDTFKFSGYAMANTAIIAAYIGSVILTSGMSLPVQIGAIFILRLLISIPASFIQQKIVDEIYELRTKDLPVISEQDNSSYDAAAAQADLDPENLQSWVHIE